MEHGHRKNGYKTYGEPNRQQTNQPKYKITVSRLPNTGVQSPIRPDDQQKSLANRNCGNENSKFGIFQKKHVIDPGMTTADKWAGLAYLTTALNRIKDAYDKFTYFFVKSEEQITYLYNDATDQCLAQEHFPAVTCQRHKRGDHISVCTYSGYCRPTYYKSSGHLSYLDCQRRNELEVPDFIAKQREFRALQDQFVFDFISAPPTQLDWELSFWRAQRHTAIRQGRVFNLPKPTGPLTRRELIYVQYKEALRNGNLLEVPEDVKRLFYMQPRLVVTNIPNQPRRGVYIMGDSWLTINPDYEMMDVSTIPPAPIDDNFPVLGEPVGTLSIRNRRFPTEYQADTSPDEYDEVSRIGQRIIQEIFTNTEEQVIPTEEALNFLYSND